MTFKRVCLVNFTSEIFGPTPSGWRIEDYTEKWVKTEAMTSELRAVIDEVGAFLESKPSERDCRAFLDESGADIRKLDTRDLSLLAFLEFWHRLAKQKLASLK